MSSDGGEEISCSSGGMAEVFEKRHGELVEEAEALAAETGAGVTVLAVSPRSGAPRVSVFPAGGGGRPGKKLAWEAIRKLEEAVGMDAAEIVALEERVRRVHQRIGGAEKAGYPGEKLAGEIRKKRQEVAGMDAAEVVALRGQLQELRLSVLRQIKEKEKAAGAGVAPSQD